MGNALGGTGLLRGRPHHVPPEGADQVSPLVMVNWPVNMISGYLAMHCRALGPNLVWSPPPVRPASPRSASHGRCCMPGRLRHRARRRVGVGADPHRTASLHKMGALSRRTEDPAGASRPFDADRGGFVAAEAAGVLVLERRADGHAEGPGSAPGQRLRGVGRRLPRLRPGPDGRRARSGRCGRRWPTPASTRRRSATSTPMARRRRRTTSPSRPSSAGYRRPPPGHLDQGSDRPPDRRGRSRRGRVHGAGGGAGTRAADREPGARSTPRWRSMSSPGRRARRRRRGDVNSFGFGGQNAASWW